MGKLEGKIGLVTGGTSGIGLAAAKRFVDEGAYVFITGRRAPELTTAVKEIGRSVTGVQSDVSKLDDLDRLFAQIKHEKNRLDVVFANAGIAKYARLGTITEDFYDFFQHQCERSCLYSAESTSSVAGWRLDRSEFVHRREQRTIFEQCLQSHYSCDSLVRADMDDRSQGSPNSGERNQSGLD
jgi:NAD(P)-dependent dehydrogenase (short-subunit alcohol dehydrogenase family)